jgi:XTP/dITP diphosphohydrolase
VGVPRGTNLYLPDIDFVFKSHSFKESSDFSPEYNVRSKALQVFQKFKKPVLVDDTVFLIEKYDNFPGMYASWLIRSIGINGVVKLVKNGDKALFRCYLGFYDGVTFKIFKREIKECLQLGVNCGKDKKGLDYSALFRPQNERRIMADFYRFVISFDSHRMRAIRKLSRFLQKYYESG